MKSRLSLSAAVLVALLGSSASAATTYKFISVDLKSDSSLGTFVNNGKTFGAIIGIGYVLEATADDGTKARFASDFWLNTPQLALPTLANLKTAVRNDASSKNAKARMNADLAKAAVDSQLFIPVLGEDTGL